MRPEKNAPQKKDTLKNQGFYTKSAWRRCRLLALQRDKYLCQHCLKKNRVTPATEVHHIVPLEERPDLGLELSNLVSLCHACHDDTKLKQSSIVNARPGIRVIKI